MGPGEPAGGVGGAEEVAAAAVEEEWLASALATGPADRGAAEAGVATAYRAAGLDPPERIVWVGSPYAGAIAAAIAGGSGATRAGGGAAGEVAALLAAQGWRPGDDPGPGVRARVRTDPWRQARADALAAFGPTGWARLSAAAGRRGWRLVMDQVAGPVRRRLGEDLAGDGWPAAARARLLDAVYGQHDAAWLATFAAADRLRPDGGHLAGLAGLAAVARTAGWWWPFARLAVLSERPAVLARDNLGRLHRGDGPAVHYPDGYGLFVWRGMPIPAGLAAELPRLTLDRIRAERNAELRRVMLEHYGFDRYLRDAGADRVDEDETGVLWRVRLHDDEPLVMVEVVNATPEPDGTRRRYWLRVPPQTRTAREGVAWTFGLDAADYAPLVQT